MSKRQNDIGDDEIRIISAGDSRPQAAPPAPCATPRRTRRRRPLAIAAVCIVALGALLFGWYSVGTTPDSDVLIVMAEPAAAATPAACAADTVGADKAYVEFADTVVNGIQLSLFTPRHATPSLQVGSEALKSDGAVMVVQAADVRRDNGQIVGAYVSKGELLSRGQSKSGFCAIIGGTPVIGVADATPYLEKAIESDGYFFRQYPLVVGHQMVENKLKSESLRKALAELNGEIVVVMSKKRMTLNDFANALVDLGVNNAIYLVGSSSYGFAVDRAGTRLVFGNSRNYVSENTNYLIWR